MPLDYKKMEDMTMSEMMENAVVNTEKSEETKAEKFIRLGEYRMNKAIEAIGRLENLSNRSAYEYTPEQVEPCSRYWSSVWHRSRKSLRRQNPKRAFPFLSGQKRDRRTRDEYSRFKHGG